MQVADWMRIAADLLKPALAAAAAAAGLLQTAAAEVHQLLPLEEASEVQQQTQVALLQTCQAALAQQGSPSAPSLAFPEAPCMARLLLLQVHRLALLLHLLLVDLPTAALCNLVVESFPCEPCGASWGLALQVCLLQYHQPPLLLLPLLVMLPHQMLEAQNKMTRLR